MNTLIEAHLPIFTVIILLSFSIIYSTWMTELCSVKLYLLVDTLHTDEK